MNKPTLILLTYLLSFLYAESQDYLKMINSEEFTVQEIQNAAQEYFDIRGTERGTGSLDKSFNQGQSRIGLPSPNNKSGNWITPFEQDPTDSNTIYSGYDKIYKSTNGGENLSSGGQSWVSISQDFGSNVNHFKIALLTMMLFM